MASQIDSDQGLEERLYGAEVSLEENDGVDSQAGELSAFNNSLDDIHSGKNGSFNLLDESLAFEPLEDLDELEFDLPNVDFHPSLEEILEGTIDENSDNFDDDEENARDSSLLASTETLQTEFLGVGSILESLSVSSGDNLSRGSKNRGQKRPNSDGNQRMGDHGAIMRHVILKGLSSQLSSASERVGTGLPTVMTSSSFYIAVGTSNGFVLVFDGNQVLKCSLGGAHLGNQHGAVSCLCFSPDSSHLLVGFAKGTLLEFEVASGKVSLALPDAHTPNAAVMHIRFFDASNKALISNSGGSVFEITISQKVSGRGYSSRCIFSGCRGEVCTFEPLPLRRDPNMQEQKLRSIMAMATISKVIILSVKKSPSIVFSHAVHGAPDTLPLLSWQFVPIQTRSLEKVVDPVLAFGRDRTVFFVQLTTTLSKKISFIFLQKLELPYQILSFSWLTNRFMGMLDVSEVLHLYDIKYQEELESIDLADVEIIYGTSFFKGLATGGNVSKAMTIASERAVYESVKCFTNQMLILGRRSFHALEIRSWNERLDHMMKNNRFIDALQLGCAFYKDQSKALVGLRGPKSKRKSQIGRKVLAILLKFLDLSMTKNFPAEGNIHILSDYFHNIIPTCVSTCITLHRKDLLFENVWNSFNIDPFGKAVFLESLEPYLLSDQLKNIPVSVCQEFVKHFVDLRKFQALEACLTHIQVTSLDIHQVMSLSWQHKMYDVIICIYNKGMIDYVSPMEELMSELMSAVSESSQSNSPLKTDQIKLGNKILVYISGCLAGRAYPHGDIPKDQVATAKYDVYNCLSSLHSKKPSENELTYPYLRALLQFDSQGLLNVISMAFEEQDFQTEMGKRRKERLVDILLDIMIKGQVDHFSPTQVGHLFTFLARQIAKDDKSFFFDRTLFQQVLEILTQANDKSHHDERQQALIDMLNIGGLQYFDRDKLIKQAEMVGFYRVLELLYEQSNEQEKILRCYLNDEGPRCQQVFGYIQRVLVDGDNNLIRQKVEQSVKDELVTLMELNSKKTAYIIYSHMYGDIPEVIDKLESNQELLYEFLKNAFELHESGSVQSSPSSHTECQPADKVKVIGSKDLFEKYIDLMCQFESNRVSGYLKSKSNLDLKAMLTICTRHKIEEAQAYLLEKDGRIKEAFDLVRKRLEAQLSEIFVGTALTGSEKSLFWAKVNATVILIVQLCQRASQSNLNENDRNTLWFQLLDVLMRSQSSYNPSEDDVRNLRDITSHVVSSTIGHVSLRLVIDKILKDPIYQTSSFGDIKDFLTEIFSTYHYEETLLQSTVGLARLNMHQQSYRLMREAGRGVSVVSVNCDLCHSHLAMKGGRSIIFMCGHKFHPLCLQQAGCNFISLRGEEKWQCYSCISDNPAKVKNDHRPSLKGKGALNYAHNKPLVTEKELDNIVHNDLVVAREYLAQLKRKEGPLHYQDIIQNPDSGDLKHAVSNEVQLKLWPDPNHQEEFRS